MINSLLLQTVEQLVLFSQPLLGQWQDLSALTLSRRLEEVSARLRRLGVEAKALDLLLAVPGV